MGRVKSAAMTVDDVTSPHEFVQHRRSPRPALRSPLVPRCGPPLRLRYGLRSLYLIPPPATLLDGTAEHTKAQDVVPDVRRVPVAVRRTAVVGVEVPTAAPVHPARAYSNTSPFRH